ncbi:MAG: 2-C-methyl-D-erythritol 4-phosphate cytidylyltransferase [Desulfovibrionaceae bacterium]|nr:2-C-methyl-D-erythritol 4-phosphate cytidylyltransferase [Desulfovibrionaceae bacterium]
MNNECWGLLPAAGQGSRLAAATGGEAKQFLRWKGAPLWWSAARALAASPRVHGLVLVFPPDRLEAATTELAGLDRARSLGVPWKSAAGGPRRQDSVRLGLAALPASCATVLIHDAARPFVSTALVTRVADALNPPHAPNAPDGAGSAPAPRGVIPGLPVSDTIKEVDEAGQVLRTPNRAAVRAVQTPQGFWTAELAAAHRRAEAEGWEVTDDASLMERCGHRVLVIPGEESNRKITRPEDLALLADGESSRPCSGWGYDVHRYGGSRPLILGGVPIPGDWAVSAHSDGDVLLHALMDALLGCMGAGDLGRWFPDNDPRWEGAPSSLMLDMVLDMALEAGLEICHADLTIIAQKPRLAPHADQIRRNVARLLRLGEDQVNVKATTEEGLGFTGECLGLKAAALVTGLRRRTAFTPCAAPCPG